MPRPPRTCSRFGAAIIGRGIEHVARVSNDDDVREISADVLDEVGADEGWTRVIDVPEVRGVRRLMDAPGIWSVVADAAEAVRGEPLRTEIRDRVGDALRAAPGVTGIDDNEPDLWIIAGSPNGRALVLAVASVVDELAPRIRDDIRGHGHAEHQ